MDAQLSPPETQSSIGEHIGRLVLSRRKGETIRIGDLCQVTVVRIHENRVKFYVSAPKDVPIVREELVTRKRAAG